MLEAVSATAIQGHHASILAAQQHRHLLIAATPSRDKRDLTSNPGVCSPTQREVAKTTARTIDGNLVRSARNGSERQTAGECVNQIVRVRTVVITGNESEAGDIAARVNGQQRIEVTTARGEEHWTT